MFYHNHKPRFVLPLEEEVDFLHAYPKQKMIHPFPFLLSYHRLSLYLMLSGTCVIGAAYLEFGSEWKALRVLLFKIADRLMRNWAWMMHEIS